MLKINRQYLEIVLTALTEKTGIKYKDGKGWSYHVKDNILTYDSKDIIERSPLVIKGLLIHETGHAIYTNPLSSDTPLYKQYKGAWHSVINLLEDLRIEQKMIEKYGQFADDNLREARDCFLLQYAAEIDKSREAYRTKQSKLRQFLLAMFAMGNRYRYERYFTTGCNSEVSQIISYNETKIMGIAKSVKAMGSVDEVERLASDDLYPIIKPLLDQEPDQQEHDAISKMSKDKGENKGQQNEKMQLNYAETKALLASYIYTLSTKLKRVIEENGRPTLTGRHKHGILTGGRVVDVILNHDKPFKKRGNPTTIDYDFFVALDASGSMARQHRGVYSYLTTVLLIECLRKMSMNATVFTFGSNVNQIATTKEPYNLDTYKVDENSTHDADVLEKIISIRKQNTHKPAILFLIGDGKGDSMNTLQPLFTKLEKLHTTVFGIGIGEDAQAVTDHYPNPIEVKKPEMLVDALVHKLQKLIARNTLY